MFLRKIVSYLNDPDSVLLRNEVENDINLSEEKRKIFNQVNLIWENSADLQLLEHLDVNSAVSALLQKLNSSDEVQPAVKRSLISKITQWSVAAAVLLLGVMGYWYYQQSNKVEYQVKSTLNVIDSVQLSDGTRIYLDKNSSLTYPTALKGQFRQVYLTKGQAFFKVFRNPAHPFIVGINQASVTVLGTTFNINAVNNQIRLSVSTGKVKFEPNNGDGTQWVLTAGAAITYNEIARTCKTYAAGTNSDAWLTNKLEFVDASLADVCKQLGIHYKVEIQISGNISAFKKLNAVFKDNKLNEILQVLQETYPIKIDKTGIDKISIRSLYNRHSKYYSK